MKTLIKHLWLNNREEILEKSIFNCHLMGLHSIMLSEVPGKTIRLYYAESDSDLHVSLRNGEIDIDDFKLAFHAHNTNLTLKPVMGNFKHAIIRPAKYNPDFELNAYKYNSHLKGATMGFESVGTRPFKWANVQNIGVTSKVDSIFLDADDVHSLSIDSSQQTDVAWLVFEGQIDESYEPLCFTTDKEYEKLKKKAGMYAKMPEKDIEKFLENCGLL